MEFESLAWTQLFVRAGAFTYGNNNRRSQHKATFEQAQLSKLQQPNKKTQHQITGKNNNQNTHIKGVQNFNY